MHSIFIVYIDEAHNLHMQQAIDYFYKAKGIIINNMQSLINALQDHKNSLTYKDIYNKLNEVLKAKSSVNIDEIKKIKLKISENLVIKVMKKTGIVSVEQKEKILKKVLKYNEGLCEALNPIKVYFFIISFYFIL